MRHTQRRVFAHSLSALLVGLITLIALAACGNSMATSNSPSLRIGYQPDVHGAGIIAVANHQNFWQQAGIQAQTKSFSTGPAEVQAMVGGDLDIAYLGPGAAWLCATGKCTVIAVDSLNVGDYVLAQPGKGITSLADLKGKKVGVPLGTSGEMVLDLALQKVGLTEKDVQLEPLDPASVVTAFISGQIDAAAIWSPLTTQIEQRVPQTKVLIDDSAFFPQHSFPQMWVAAPSLVKNHPDLVQKFLKAFILANDYRVSHLLDTVQWTASFAQIPSAGLQAQVTTTKWLSSSQIQQDNSNGATYQWFQSLNQLFVQMKKISSVGDAKSYVNVALFTQARKST
jgi:NitT/TauT family transport system substrate-binding protein